MKCPHCKKELKVPVRCYLNAEQYHNNCIAATECCGKAVAIVPVVTFGIYPYKGDRKEDDWGVKIK